MSRYTLEHPHTVTVTFPDLQAVADFAFNFRNLPDFNSYTIRDRESGNFYSVENVDAGIEFTFQGCRA